MQTPINQQPLPSGLHAAYAAAGLDRADLDFFQTPEWFANLADTCLLPGEHAAVLSTAGAILPIRTSQRRLGPVKGLEARSLSNFYSCHFAPPGFGQAGCAPGTARAFGQALRQSGYASLRFDALAGDECNRLADGLAAAGWLVEPFPQFGNWRLETAGLSFADYWRRRPGRLRNTGKRRKKALLGGNGPAALHRFTAPEETDAAIEAYAVVAARSWQKEEPFPRFLPGLIRYGLAAQQLEVWALIIDNAPVAAQIWVVRNRQATIFKLAFDQAHGKLSAGTVLTMCAIESMLARQGIDVIDFGWGDDPYKRDWLPQRRQRFGLAAYNPRTTLGLALAARNLPPKLIRAARCKTFGKIKRRPI